VFGVLVALVGLGATLGRPLLSLNTSIVTLTTKLEGLTDDLSELTDRNAKSHERLWAHNDKQDKKLEDHEHRIQYLEDKQ